MNVSLSNSGGGQVFNAITSGCMCFWDASDCVAEALKDDLRALGAGLEAFAPKPRTEESALGMALKDVGQLLVKTGKIAWSKRSRLMTERKAARGDGVELVKVVKHGSVENDYEVLLTARVEQGSLRVTHGWLDSSDRLFLLERWESYCQQTAGASVGRSLVDIIKCLHGTCVRPVGGVYYLPEGEVALWDQVIGVYEKHGSTVTRAKVVMDDKAARSIKKAVVDELSMEAAELLDDLMRNDIRDETVKRRLRKAKELRSKCVLYEEVLSDTLAGVHTLLDSVEKSQGITQAVSDDDALFADDSVFA